LEFIVRHAWTFVREYLRAPRTIGAVAPSSRGLAELIVNLAGVAQADVIVEFGPGTGAFTQRILEVKRPGAKLVAVEFHPKMAAQLRLRFPQVDVVEDSVANLGRILAERGIKQVDSIVSGLPWAAFDAGLRDQLLEATLVVLKPGGRFATFGYLEGSILPTGRRFRRKIQRLFTEVHRSPIVWANMPPAFVYQCVR
jgi:phosphatidylethanolamine/phosphatidyl-N-methylethanolamine N-methyltransferase